MKQETKKMIRKKEKERRKLHRRGRGRREREGEIEEGGLTERTESQQKE